MGGRQSEHEHGKWTWEHSSADIILGSWHNGEPSGDGRCLMQFGVDHDYNWNDESCFKTHQFLCQYSTSHQIK